jgi:tetratricopeptide (TPR) repeat protein
VKSPDNSSFYDLLGAALFHFVKDLHRAETALAKSISLDGHNIDAIIQLCQVQAASGEIDRAIATGEQALKQNPRETGISIVLGDLYAARENWKAAETAYQRALTIDPLNPVAANDLAGTMLHTGESLDAALSLAQKAHSAMPESPAVADTIGWIYYQRGEYQLALNSLEEALDLQIRKQMPVSLDIRYHLGMTYAKTRQRALARQNLEQVLKTAPNYKSASEIRAELLALNS